MNIKDILLKKAADQALAHFYILETGAPEAEAFPLLLNFVHDFIRDYYQKVEGHKQSLTNLMDHPDVFVMGNTLNEEEEKSDKFFKVEESEALGRFFEFKAVQGIRKFAVITEAHRINTTVANKWLKILEEPQGTSTIFLLNPRRIELLPTIHSRAIHLRLPFKRGATELSHWNEMMEDLKNLSLSEFIENYREDNISYWINELIKWESTRSDQMGPKANLGKWLKNFQEMETFHQPTATKWALFHAYLRQEVLPRLN